MTLEKIVDYMLLDKERMIMGLKKLDFELMLGRKSTQKDRDNLFDMLNKKIKEKKYDTSIIRCSFCENEASHFQYKKHNWLCDKHLKEVLKNNAIQD